MIFRALACDYDGTLASQDRIGPEARAALERAREAGLRLVMVTGRTFFDLTRVCDCLELFDAVVAENDAVLYWPRSQTLRDQAPAPSSRLLAELDRRGIAYQVGRVVVDTARTNEPGVREALEATGVALDLVYNRAFLMLLPHGVSKGTGVRHVIRDLGLSFHDVLGIGDAENDAELFDACGYTACPADAVPALKARADWVFPGANGAGVAQAITGQILNGTLQVADSPRHQVQIGWAVETCEPVKISARGVNVLVHGDPLSGKSWLAGALVERLVASRYAVCVLDPEGDYHVLARLPGITWAEIRTKGPWSDCWRTSSATQSRPSWRTSRPFRTRRSSGSWKRGSPGSASSGAGSDARTGSSSTRRTTRSMGRESGRRRSTSRPRGSVWRPTARAGSGTRW
jgi:hydroxymethylpyrimidine pyrophosphatase-like HAD family hydrolase